jgi:RimJ/RimL family protein N-acetyltransferase
MKPIRTNRLILRNWVARDRDLFFRINSDERVMEFFPFRRDQAESDAKMEELREEAERLGYGFTAVELASTGKCIGFVGLRDVEIKPFVAPGSIEIGWRLAPQFWGSGYVTEAASALLDFAFDKLDKPEVVSFAVWNNAKSIAVMERLGMKHQAGQDFNHPEVPNTHAHLKRHVLYKLDRADWHKQKRAAK